MKKLFGWISEFFKWIAWKFRKKYKRLYYIYNSDAPEHVGLHMRGFPRPLSKVIIKGGTADNKARHFEVYVLQVFKLDKGQVEAAGLDKGTEAYYVDGKYNDLEIKRIY